MASLNSSDFDLVTIPTEVEDNFTSSTTALDSTTTGNLSTEIPILSNFTLLASTMATPISNYTSTEAPMPMVSISLLSVFLGLIIALIVLGNLLVIVAVLTQRSLLTPPNILIMSLAVTDFTVGVFILPLNLSDMFYGWIFSENLCTAWLTLDVTLCSTSILHLSAIAIDRYRSISEGVTYLQSRTKGMAVVVSVSMWIIALWIASAPALGWNDKDSGIDTGKVTGNNTDTGAKEEPFACVLPRNLGYIVHSALGAFFLPASVMTGIYIKIYYLIRERLRQRVKSSVVTTAETSQEWSTGEPGDKRSKMSNSLPRNPQGRKPSDQIEKIIETKIRFSLTKERKAARTLGIIIGAFIICWTPFTLVYIASGVCGNFPELQCQVPGELFQFVTWLGYVNSALNPIIYTVYNAEFRKAFKYILCCWWRRRERVGLFPNRMV